METLATWRLEVQALLRQPSYDWPNPSTHSWKTQLSFPKPGLLLFTLRSLEQEGRQAAVTQGHPELSEPAGPTSDANHLLRED